MIGRKLVLLSNGQASHHGETFFKTEHLEELKRRTIKNAKHHGYRGLVATIRFYVKSSNLVVNKYQEIKIKIIEKKSRLSGNRPERQEVSKFLKMISEYKHKIREIKHKIKEEEDIL